MHTSTEYWVGLAQRDIHSARVLLAAGDTGNCLMLCQQALEKALKAHLQEMKGEPPPRIHNLIRLAALAGMEGVIPEAQLETLADLSPFAVEGRYPQPPLAAEAAGPDIGLVGELLQRGEEALEWLLARLR
jgi:HEPN domain-containing protein